MPRQNRVDPLGALHAVTERGGWMGNRGCLHDAQGQIRRTWQVRRWITCVTEFKDRQRQIMRPGHYTELFFHDEATAYAAGHRPCAECRRAAYRGFLDLWRAEIGAVSGAEALDLHLHAARLSGRVRRYSAMAADAVPVGAMIDAGGPLLRAPVGWARWSFGGYRAVPAPKGRVHVLTPAPILRLMQAGLAVQIGATAPGVTAAGVTAAGAAGLDASRN